MSVTHILADLRQRNITVRTKGDDLCVIADKGALSPELRAILANHKQEIVRYLRRLDEGEAAEITPVADRGSWLPLSFGQQRLWFLAQLEPDSAAYVIPAAVRIQGPLEAAILVSSLDQIVQRHEVLRTVFANKDGHPAQMILTQMAVPFSFIDLRQNAPATQNASATQEEMLEHWVRSEASRPFDLATGPLLRAMLLQLAEQEHVLLLTLHHIVADGWSVEVLIRELSAFYLAFQTGKTANLPALPVQYADYAVWQQRWREGPMQDRQLAYWRRQLADLVPLALPTDHPRLERRSPRGASSLFVVPTKTAGRLRLLGLEEEATLFMVLLAAFQVLLSRYSGQQQIAVGTAVANRERKEIEGLIGFFVNTLVLFADTGRMPSFREFLGQVRKTTLDAFENQDLPFEQLVDDLQPARSLNQNPLFQVMFMLQNVPRSEMQLGAIKLQPFNVENSTAKFDLAMSLSEDGGKLQGWVSYNAELFEPATMTRMIEHYCVLLSGIVEKPEQSIAELPLLAEAEREQLLVEWNETAVDYPQKCIHELFEQQVAATPAAVAVEYEGQQWAYAELNHRTNQVARYLRALGVRPDVRVGICMEQSLEMITGLLGVLKAGGTYIPLDPGYPAERLAFMLQEAQASVILIQEKFSVGLPQHTAKLVKLDAEWARIGKESDENLNIRIEPENLAYVMFTSGSTGRPKGVMVTHGGLANYLDWAVTEYPVREGKGSPLHTSMSFDLSLTSLLPALIAGQRVIVTEEGEELQEVVKGLHSGEGFSLVKATPSHLHVFREMLSGRDGIVAPSAFVIGGEAVCYEDVKWWREHTPSARLINEYGPTETVVGCCVYEIEPQDRRNGPIPIGQPIANTRLYVVDQQGELTAVGVFGELCIGGAGLARGYVNRPDLTAERFVPDHMSGQAGERLYRTGDKARWRADGNLDYLGRMDDQVKIRGHRIELGEIEAVLMQHGAVEQAVIVVREDQPGDKRLIGYVVYQDGAAGARSSALREYLRERLPEYMVPGVIVEIEKLPLTPNGKINRKALPEPEYQGVEEQIAPRNVEEEILCGIFAEVLKLEQMGMGQNFFEAGGHSLLATQVISRIKGALGVNLPLRALFEAPTVAGLAERVERARGVGQVAAPPLVCVARDQAIPLSFAQQRLWFLDQLRPNSATYNSSVALRLQGELKLESMEWVFSEIVRRHEVLRTRMEVVHGQARQVIAAAAAVSIPVTDLSLLEPEEREAELRRCIREEAETPFDLSRGPLLRIKLLRQEEEDHVLLVTMHHIVTDGWSMGIIVQEFSRLYKASALGEESPLPELPIQYADFAVWQREWLQGEVLERQTGYWRNQLAEAPALEMPTDYPREAAVSEAGASLKWELSEELCRKLREMSRREGVTLFMTLLAGFQLLLSRHSGQSDIATGSPIAGRTRTEIEGLIGFFANTLVLRTDLSGGPVFRELLGRVREMTLTAYAHQDVPFEKLVEELQPDRDLSRSPLFQAMFLLQNAPSMDLQLPGLKLSLMDRVAETVHFELLLSASETNGRIGGGLSYRTNLFGEGSIRRLLGHWQNLLASIVNSPQKRIGELTMLSEAELRQIVEEWNRTETEYRQLWVHEMVAEHAAKTPTVVAVEYAGQQLSYGELNQHANQLAHYLKKMGAGPEGLVGICVERSLEMTVGVLAILKTGAAYVPLDPKYPSSRLSYMLENSRIKLLVTQEQFLDTFASGVKSTICLDSEWQKISKESQANLNVDVDSDNVAFVIYTSGSTGWPKGVALRHGQAANLVHWHLQRSSGNPPLRTLQFASLSFDVSFQDIFATWCAGGCLVLIEEDTRRDPSELWRALCDQKVERVSLPFVALQQLAEVAARTERAASLRELISAGEQLKITPALQKLFNQLPTCVLENQYGPSETHVVTTYRAGRDPGEWTLLPPIGKPTANTQVYLLNEECLSVPVGVAGELYLGGAQLARGYVNRPELTAERFLPNPFSKEPGGRLYKTGDLARYLKDGNVEYMGRVDSQVKIRGYRVEVGEVESALSECEGVGQAAVVVREDRPGEKRLVAYVVSRDGQQLSESKLRSDLKDRLPEFMVPAAVVVMEQLTLTPSGKVDRKRLPDPGRSLGEKEEQYVGPRNATEEILCGIWEDLLKREPIGVTRNFFEVGGHSLLAMQLMARIGDALQVDLPVRRLFEAPTVMELARVIEQLTAAGGREKVLPIVRAPRDQEIPLSFAQQRLWFLDQLQPGSASYNLPAALRLSGAIRSDLVEYVFRELTRRHEALRTTFSVQEGQPIQIIAPVEAMSFSMLLTDLSGLPEEVGEAEAKRLAEEEAGQPFDLNRGPLLRVKLVRLAEQEHVLLVTMHHIVSDGWSIGIMVREFIQLYEAYAKGEERLLPELPIQYADFSVWQREWLQGAILEEQVQYWMQQLAGVQALELPTDRPRPAVMSHAGASVEFSLGSAQMEHLKGLSRRQGTSLYMVFLAAFQTLLFRYSGQQDIAVGSPIAGRRRTETEGLIGFFVNTLVMRTDVSGGLGFTELLRQVREVALEAYTHQDVPFEKVVEELQPERDLSRTPLFQVMFALQNAPRSELQLGAVKLRPFNVDNQTAKFDLSMALSEDGEKLQGWVGYNAALFELATVARMIEHYCVLLSGIVQNPEQSIAELPLLGQAERQQLLVEWNKTAVYHPQKCLPEMFEEQVATTPAAVAVEYEGRDLTYAELNRCANQLGHYLRKLGVGPEVRVGICIERGLNMVIGLLAVLKAGGAYVPLDPNYPPERLAYMQEDAQAPVLLTQERLGGNLPVSRQRVVCLDRDWEQIAAYPETNPHPAAFPENLAYVIYTSGSTGKPKGVCIAHGSACNLAVAQAKVFSVKPGDSVLQFASLNFDASVWEWLMALLSGARLVLADEQTLLPGQAFAELLERESVSVATLPPSILAALPQTDLPRLQTLIVAGEMCGANLVEQWAAGRLMFNAYGPTEVTVCATISDPLLKAGGAPIGKPIANAQVYVLDGFMEAVPVGVMGELYIGGAGLARGYMNRPEITAEKFVPNPFAGRAGERLYRTGDLVKWRAEGNLEYLGRMDHQVKVRGFRIELGEIEAMLVQQNEVEQAVVMVREDEPGEKRLVAYMVTREEIAASELRERLKQRLPNYMVPSAFVNLAAMPLTPNGKVDRLALSKNFRAEQMHERTYIAPRTVTEEVVAQIWSELLKVERIGMNDSFFALGGHSLLVFRLKTMMQSRLGCDLPLSSLFQDPTISGLAKLLETPANEPSSPILAPMQTNGSSAPFFCVHPVGGQVVCYADLSRELGQNQPFYGLQSPDPSQTQVATIEHMASLYIQEIRHIQPSGPYLLGGWSMGGLVAFEMAHQLIDQGETIDLLTLFDMVPPSEFSGEIEPKRSFSMLERFALDMARLVLRNADELREHFLQLGPEEQFKLILDVLVREGVLPEASGQFELNRLLDIFTRNASAVENYRLRPMKQRIVLFAAAGREDPEQLAEKWEPWTTGGVELRAVQGDHYTILKPPHVTTIASDLKHYLKSEHAVAVSQ